MSRALAIALVASAAVHATVLLVRPPQPVRNEAVDVAIVEVAPPPPAMGSRGAGARPPAAAPVRARSSRQQPARQAPQEAPARQADEPPALPSVVIVEATAAGPGSRGSDGAAPAGALAAAGSGPPAAGSPAGVPGGDGRDGKRLHDWLAERAYRCYPRAADRLGIEGTPQVHFCVDAAGQPLELRLSAASGSRALDRAAIECVIGEAAPLPIHAGCYDVPVSFEHH